MSELESPSTDAMWVVATLGIAGLALGVATVATLLHGV